MEWYDYVLLFAYGQGMYWWGVFIGRESWKRR